MTPGKGTSGEFDERLEEALKGALLDGENVVARETGDQGQGIILTDSRIFIIKAGFAATGELDGLKANAYPFNIVSSVNLRKGPLGAVIQVCVDKDHQPPQGTPPADNVVIFSGPQRMKRAEIIAGKIESALGKSVNKTEPPAAVEPQVEDVPKTTEVEAEKNTDTPKPKAGRKPRSLADEMFSEMSQQTPVPEQKQTPPAAVPDPEPISKPDAAAFDLKPVPEPTPEPAAIEIEKEPESELEPEPSTPGFGRNPNLPKPSRRKQSGSKRVLVLLGILAVVLMVSMAITAPKATDKKSIVQTSNKVAKLDMMDIRAQQEAISVYRGKINPYISKSNVEAAAFTNALRSGKSSAVLSAGQTIATDEAWKKLSKLNAPSGLVDVKDNLTSGLALRKNTISIALISTQSGDAINTREMLGRLKEADSRINKGIDIMNTTFTDLEKQASSGSKEE